MYEYVKFHYPEIYKNYKNWYEMKIKKIRLQVDTSSKRLFS